jgi:hypothetical protein
MDPGSESGELTLRYPVFAVLSDEPDGGEGLVVVEIDGEESILLFRSREVGELYLQQVESTGEEPPLTLHECRGDEELKDLLTQLPSSVANVVWDATLEAQALKMTAIPDLLAALQADSE